MIKINDKQLELMNFPNGETRIKLPEEPEFKKRAYIDWKFESDSELFQMMGLVDAIRGYYEVISLRIKYLPYSRMDRVEDKLTLFTLKTFCKAINDMMFDDVHIYEPHSDVCVALLENVKVHSVTERLVDVAKNRIDIGVKQSEKLETILVFPDAGASKRYAKMFPQYKSVVGFKKRDFETGKITHMQIIGEVPQKGFNAIIVDDLSSYGGTFMMAGNSLKQLGANKIMLCVTHCEDSIYKGDVLKTDVIDLVITTDSILSIFDSQKIVVV